MDQSNLISVEVQVEDSESAPILPVEEPATPMDTSDEVASSQNLPSISNLVDAIQMDDLPPTPSSIAITETTATIPLETPFSSAPSPSQPITTTTEPNPSSNIPPILAPRPADIAPTMWYVPPPRAARASTPGLVVDPLASSPPLISMLSSGIPSFPTLNQSQALLSSLQDLRSVLHDRVETLGVEVDRLRRRAEELELGITNRRAAGASAGTTPAGATASNAATTRSSNSTRNTRVTGAAAEPDLTEFINDDELPCEFPKRKGSGISEMEGKGRIERRRLREASIRAKIDPNDIPVPVAVPNTTFPSSSSNQPSDRTSALIMHRVAESLGINSPRSRIPRNSFTSNPANVAAITAALSGGTSAAPRNTHVNPTVVEANNDPQVQRELRALRDILHRSAQDRLLNDQRATGSVGEELTSRGRRVNAAAADATNQGGSTSTNTNTTGSSSVESGNGGTGILAGATRMRVPPPTMAQRTAAYTRYRDALVRASAAVVAGGASGGTSATTNSSATGTNSAISTASAPIITVSPSTLPSQTAYTGSTAASTAQPSQPAGTLSAERIDLLDATLATNLLTAGRGGGSPNSQVHGPLPPPTFTSPAATEPPDTVDEIRAAARAMEELNNLSRIISSLRDRLQTVEGPSTGTGTTGNAARDSLPATVGRTTVDGGAGGTAAATTAAPRSEGHRIAIGIISMPRASSGSRTGTTTTRDLLRAAMAASPSSTPPVTERMPSPRRPSFPFARVAAHPHHRPRIGVDPIAAVFNLDNHNSFDLNFDGNIVFRPVSAREPDRELIARCLSMLPGGRPDTPSRWMRLTGEGTSRPRRATQTQGFWLRWISEPEPARETGTAVRRHLDMIHLPRIIAFDFAVLPPDDDAFVRTDEVELYTARTRLRSHMGPWMHSRVRINPLETDPPIARWGTSSHVRQAVASRGGLVAGDYMRFDIVQRSVEVYRAGSGNSSSSRPSTSRGLGVAPPLPLLNFQQTLTVDGGNNGTGTGGVRGSIQNVSVSSGTSRSRSISSSSTPVRAVVEPNTGANTTGTRNATPASNPTRSTPQPIGTTPSDDPQSWLMAFEPAIGQVRATWRDHYRMHNPVGEVGGRSSGQGIGGAGGSNGIDGEANNGGDGNGDAGTYDGVSRDRNGERTRHVRGTDRERTSSSGTGAGAGAGIEFWSRDFLDADGLALPSIPLNRQPGLLGGHHPHRRSGGDPVYSSEPESAWIGARRSTVRESESVPLLAGSDDVRNQEHDRRISYA